PRLHHRFPYTTLFRATYAKANHRAVTGTGPSDRHPEWSVTYGMGLDYFVEDAWSVGIAWTGLQLREPDDYRRDLSFQVGITYRLDRKSTRLNSSHGSI